MEFAFITSGLESIEAELLAVGVFEGRVGEVKALSQLDQALGGKLTVLIDQEQFKGKDGERLALHTLGLVVPQRLLLVGLGKREEFDVPDARTYGAAVAGEAQRMRCAHVAAALPPLDGSANERLARFFAEGLSLGDYRFDKYRKREENPKTQVAKLTLVLGEGHSAPHLGTAQAEVVARAVRFARDLVNEPAAKLTPSELAEAARELAKKRDLECRVLGKKECEKEKMGLFLAVAQGSDQEPKFIHLIYRPKGKEKPTRRVVLVGKGVTFDSGGLSLKPSASMLDMKADMAGAAAVLGIMGALPAMGIKAEVHGVIAAAENMISGGAYKLGDVISGMSGKSVEITNTDAEGRLTLADALAYAVRQQPDEIVTMATLTGACMVALGPHIAGVMGSENALIERVLAAARRVGEEVWHLPLPKNLKEQVESKIADLKNAGDRWGGALTAGLFLKEFVEQVPWVHLDIAGPAFAEKEHGHIKAGGTGFGVATMLELLSR